MSDVGLVVAKKGNDVTIGEDKIRIDLLENWEQMSDRQQKYLAEYAKQPHKPTLVAMMLGYSKTEINKWFFDSKFKHVADQIYDIYTEILKAKDYEEAFTDPKYRDRVIKAQENKGKYSKEPPKSEHKHLHIGNNSLKDVVKLIGNDSEEED